MDGQFSLGPLSLFHLHLETAYQILGQTARAHRAYPLLLQGLVGCSTAFRPCNTQSGGLVGNATDFWARLPLSTLEIPDLHHVKQYPETHYRVNRGLVFNEDVDKQFICS